MIRMLNPLLLLLLLITHAVSFRCGVNEILLRNKTCSCPFFQFNGQCMRRRYQTTVNTTMSQMQAATRHLMMQDAPLLLTLDATNREAMQALAASLAPLVGAGTVVTSVTDALDILVGGEPSATLEITNATIKGTVVTLTVDYRLPDVDFFFFFVNVGSSADAPCPPFDIMDSCCKGDMGAGFLTTGVDCSGDPLAQMERFVRAWGGSFVTKQQQFMISINLEKLQYVLLNGANVYRFGIGMVVFGRLAQNTENRVVIQFNNTITSTSIGAFQYSGIEYSRLQLETCGGGVVLMHLVVKASSIMSVQSIRYQIGDNQTWAQPDCGVQHRWMQSNTIGCNVTIDAEFVDVYAPLPLGFNASSATLYVLLSRGQVLTRVVARADGVIIQHCNEPVVVRPSRHSRDFTIDVLQGNRLKYSGSEAFVQLTDVAALTLRVQSNSTAYRYSIDNISVVYSLVEAARVLELMPEGRITPELEALCDSGNVCLIENLMELGVCTTHEKCEDQGSGVFIMPLYPWGRETLKNGTYTAMLTDIKESIIPSQPPSTIRRLLGWMMGEKH